MLERGGPTAQSGPYYQNTWAALREGRLLDKTRRLTAAEVIVSIRLEDVGKVDDVVVTFQDGHKEWVQCKESLIPKSEVWNELWKQFAEQMADVRFQEGRDRIVLQIGCPRSEHEDLKGITLRTASESAAEWLSRLNEKQKTLLDHINAQLPDNWKTTEAQRRLFQHLDVRVNSLEDLEEMAHSWLPEASVPPKTLLPVLRDRAAEAARVRETLTYEALKEELERQHQIILSAPLGLDDVLRQLKKDSAILLNHPDGIGSVHFQVPRPEVAQLFGWLTVANDDKNLALLLDGAGLGKSVVLKRFLECLEQATIPYLAIKADLQKSELLSRLSGLDSLERTIERFPVLKGVPRFVLVIDQIDALSLAMGGDREALEAALKLIARAQRLPGVRVVVSCREFDFKNDPHLAQLASAKEFPLPPLDEETVSQTLEVVSPQLKNVWLPPDTKRLLCVPLHLALFVRAAEAAAQNGEAFPVQSFQSLSDLYSRLWELIVERSSLDSSSHFRVRVLKRLSEAMTQQKAVSVSGEAWLHGASADDSHELQKAASYLASEGLLSRTGDSRWAFHHQTFYDYCFARFQVEECLMRGESVAQQVLDGPMDIKIRPQVLQLLGYLRGRHPQQFVSELEKLLIAPTLALHLRDLITRWFGAVRSPSTGEWELMQRLLFRDSDSGGTSAAALIGAMTFNLSWFEKLKGEVLRELWEEETNTLYGALMSYLRSMAHHFPLLVIEELEPLLKLSFEGERQANLARLQNICENIHDWNEEKIANFYARILEASTEKSDFSQDLEVHLQPLEKIAQHHPAIFCRVSRTLADRAWQQFQEIHEQNAQETKAEERERGENENINGVDADFYNRIRRHSARTDRENRPLTQLGQALRGVGETDVMQEVAKNHPVLWLETFLPWCLPWLTSNEYDLEPNEDKWDFLSDRMSVSSRGYNRSDLALVMVTALGEALKSLARDNEDDFLRFYQQLEPVKFETCQELLSQSLRANSQQWHGLALEYLLSDKRRFMLEDEQWESRQLISAIAPILDDSQFHRLEAAVLAILPLWKYEWCENGWRHGLRWRGKEQLNLLRAMPFDRLSDIAKKTLREWERKMPNYRAKEHAPVHFATAARLVSSPISEEAAAKMRDEQWLRALKRYSFDAQKRASDDSEESAYIGGERQLAPLLTNMTAEQPLRFGKLGADKFPDNVEAVYIGAVVRGLSRAFHQAAQPEAPPIKSLIFAVSQRFVPLLQQRLQDIQKQNDVFARSESPTEADSEAKQKRAITKDAGQTALRDMAECLGVVASHSPDEELPTPIVELLHSMLTGPACRSEGWWNKEGITRNSRDGVNDGPYNSHINSVRGQALRALWWACEAQGKTVDERRELRRTLLQGVVALNSTPQSAGAVELLLHDFHEDREGAVTLFRQLLVGHPALLHSYFSHEFMVFASHRFLPVLARPLMRLLREANQLSDPNLPSGGCDTGLGFRVGLLLGRIYLSLLGSPSPYIGLAKNLALRARQGSPAVRRGLVHAYAENAGETSISSVCLERLQFFFNDEDIKVREEIGRCFFRLGKRPLIRHPSFFEAFADSHAWRNNTRAFSTYLQKHGSLQPQWSLGLVERLLDNSYPEPPQSRNDYEIGPLLQLVLHIYENSTGNVPQQAMHLFGRLMERYPHRSQVLLDQWDSR